MSFLVVLFVERADSALHSSKLKIQNLIIPLLASVAMLTLRTPLAAVMVASLALAFIVGSQRQLQLWQKIVLAVVFVGWKRVLICGRIGLPLKNLVMLGGLKPIRLHNMPQQLYLLL